MSFSKRFVVLLIMGVFLGGSLFAIDAEDLPPLDGDALNKALTTYITNVARLVPNSSTTQNVWSFPPRTDRGYFGVGVNGSFTMSDRTMVSQLDNAGAGFGGKEIDMASIPESIPFLPAGSVDVRFGRRNSDIGITGMWLSADMIPQLSNFMGEDSDYTYRMLGFDYRLLLIKEGTNVIFGKEIGFLPARLMPSISVQAGYYFTWMTFGFSSTYMLSGDEVTDSIDIDFRTDSYFFAVQLSKDLPFIKPFVGFKPIFSSTNSEFSWIANRPVTLGGTEYGLGATYNSGTHNRDTMTYLHLYGGVGLTFIFPHIITAGFAYNVVTEHFAVTAAVRIIL